MEEEEEAHTAVDEATATAADEVEAENTTTLAQAELLREDCATLSVPVCSATSKSRQKTKQDYHGRNLCNTLARITDKI